MLNGGAFLLEKPLQEKYQQMVFKRANMPIRIAAEALHMDSQTIRIMLQMGIVPWGKAFKLPGSKKYSYLISPKAFYEATGYLWEGR